MTKDMTLGEVAYNAYCNRRGWKSVNGQELPKFEDQAIELKAAWEIAAIAVVEHNESIRE